MARWQDGKDDARAADAGVPLPKKTRKEIFLEEMNRVVPWAALVALIQPHSRGAHQALGGRSPFAVETMLRIHCLQLWWNLSDPAMEKELHERPLYREFARLSGRARLPDETTILRFCHLPGPLHGLNLPAGWAFRAGNQSDLAHHEKSSRFIRP